MNRNILCAGIAVAILTSVTTGAFADSCTEKKNKTDCEAATYQTKDGGKTQHHHCGWEPAGSASFCSKPKS